MATLNETELMKVSHYIERAELLIRVLGEATNKAGNEHHRLQMEIIEEYLYQARKTIGDC